MDTNIWHHPQKGEIEYVTNRENIQTLDVVSGRNQPPWIPETWKHGKPCPFVWWRTISLENQEESWFPPAISEERWGATTEFLLNIQPLKKFPNYNSILELLGKSHGLGKTTKSGPTVSTPKTASDETSPNEIG